MAVIVLLGPMLALLGVGVLMNPAAANCVGTRTRMSVGTVPDQLQITTANGQTFTLNAAPSSPGPPPSSRSAPRSRASIATPSRLR